MVATAQASPSVPMWAKPAAPHAPPGARLGSLSGLHRHSQQAGAGGQPRRLVSGPSSGPKQSRPAHAADKAANAVGGFPRSASSRDEIKRATSPSAGPPRASGAAVQRKAACKPRLGMQLRACAASVDSSDPSPASTSSHHDSRSTRSAGDSSMGEVGQGAGVLEQPAPQRSESQRVAASRRESPRVAASRCESPLLSPPVSGGSCCSRCGLGLSLPLSRGGCIDEASATTGSSVGNPESVALSAGASTRCTASSSSSRASTRCPSPSSKGSLLVGQHTGQLCGLLQPLATPCRNSRFGSDESMPAAPGQAPPAVQCLEVANADLEQRLQQAEDAMIDKDRRIEELERRLAASAQGHSMRPAAAQPEMLKEAAEGEAEEADDDDELEADVEAAVLKSEDLLRKLWNNCLPETASSGCAELSVAFVLAPSAMSLVGGLCSLLARTGECLMLCVHGTVHALRNGLLPC
eukprot:TRINITY_DN20704_c0_g1_i2.p1 TRINITY_DN20704_c0_g1~~TRINITY_DN20704_c0_g1_i2.p1  ORF type:complete len:466 (-),score=91.45 TRINITY_DN20704_c0_g1_i2:524-1921(-)